jgi:diaminopimelate epimerase
MTLDFFKYQGAGNDFIIIDNRLEKFERSDKRLIKFLCDRKFGIGADGLMLLQKSTGTDFEMIYYNSDGLESSMCGNGGRCIVAFARRMGIIDKKAHFIAADGEHEAIVRDPNYIKLKMIDVKGIEKGKDYFYLNTGVPHVVKFVSNIDSVDVFAEGKKIRYSEPFKPNGANVNFVEIRNENILIRTYERGIEDETLACGTGITASAIAVALHTKSQENSFKLNARGGTLQVSFERISNDSIINIWLEGPAEYVFKGKIEI